MHPCVREEKLSSTLLSVVSGSLQIKLAKDRLGTQILLMFMCTGVHRKEVKLKETVSGTYIYPFNKGKRVWTPGLINCGEVTWKYMGELMENKGYFSKVCLCKLIFGVDSPTSRMSHFSLPGMEWRG